MQNGLLFRSLVALIALATMLIGIFPTSSSHAYMFSMEDLQAPNKLNLLIMVSASNYSNGPINSEPGAKTRLEIMRESILTILEQNALPPNTNVGVMAFGHKFTEAEYPQTCSASNVEIALPFQLASHPIDMSRFMYIEGLGESPMALALETAGEIFPEPSPDVLNVILLVADGIDTCSSNPAVEARILSESKQIVIYTISFLGGASELEAIAENANGENFNIPGWLKTNQRASEELIKALNSAIDEILSQVSTPVLPPGYYVTPTSSPTFTFAFSPTPIPTLTFTPTPTLRSTPLYVTNPTDVSVPTRISIIPRTHTPKPTPQIIDWDYDGTMDANIAFNKPVKMYLDQTVSVELLLDPCSSTTQLATQIVEDNPQIEEESDQWQVETAVPEITKQIEAVLLPRSDLAFTVKDMYESPIREIDHCDIVKWRWSVTANKEGRHTLELIIRQLDNFGNVQKESSPPYTAEIKVKVSIVENAKRNWQWIATTLLIPIVGSAWGWWRKRKNDNKNASRSDTKGSKINFE